MHMEQELLAACETNNIEIAITLLEKGVSPDVRFVEGYTPLMICCGNGQLQFAQMLLKSGAHPDLKNDSGSSALKIACLKNNNALVQEILKHYANPNIEDSQGFTPIMYCVMNGYIEVIETLLSAGADPNIKSAKGGYSAIDFAHKKENWEILSLLEGRQKDSSKVPKNKEINPEDLVGQKSPKTVLKQIISLAKVNQEKLRRELPISQVTLHAIFSGNPGTGKTTFARYYAQEVKKIGILKKGHLVEVSRSDIVAEYAGQTAGKTQKVVESALGGILFIDEAYSLKTGKDDNFGQECIDTLIKLIEDHRDNLILILAGYTDEMREFAHTNPGLKSRVPNLVEFEDFNDQELSEIFGIMLKNANLTIEDKDKQFALGEIFKGRKSRSFGNGRAVRNFIDRAISQQSIRLGKKDLEKLTQDELCRLIYSDLTLNPDDEGTLEELKGESQPDDLKTGIDKLQELVGLSNVKSEIKSISDYVRVSKARNNGKVPDLGFHMVFSGNPGTGKSTVARLVAQIFKELGFLSEGQFIEADRSQLVAPYVGQTAIKTLDVIESALGGVLFVDEAYTLCRGKGDDSFGQEAIDTLLKYMEDYRNRLILIMAGYPNELDTFLSSNPGLKGRFNKVLKFDDFTDEELTEIAQLFGSEAGFTLSEDAIKALNKFVHEERNSQEHFSNARSVRNIMEQAYKNQASRLVSLGNPDEMNKSLLNEITAEDFSSHDNPRK